MKCRVCLTEIPSGERCCPNCGRVVTAAESAAEKKTKDYDSSLSERTMVYRPASSNRHSTDKTININDIFSTDPNAPVYSDPHTYDRATADVLEYDKQFMSKNSSNENDDVKVFKPQSYSQRKQQHEFPESYKSNSNTQPKHSSDSEQEETSEQQASVIRDKKNGKPHFNLKIKYIVAAVAVILGLAFIVFGIFQLGKQFGLFKVNDEDSSNTAQENTPVTPDKNESQSNSIDISYKQKEGVYTVYSEQTNIFMYKSVSEQRIIATIPNKTVIEIVEINNEYGKTTYKNYTGWVELAELKFTPNETPEKVTEPTSDLRDEPEKLTEGKYIIELNGTSTHLNVRSDPSTTSAPLTMLAQGTEVEVLEISGNWGKISVDGKDGWVFMDYLAKQ